MGQVPQTARLALGPKLEAMKTEGRDLRRFCQEVGQSRIALGKDLIDFGQHGRLGTSFRDPNAADFDSPSGNASRRSYGDRQPLIVLPKLTLDGGPNLAIQPIKA